MLKVCNLSHLERWWQDQSSRPVWTMRLQYQNKPPLQTDLKLSLVQEYGYGHLRNLKCMKLEANCS